VATLNDQDLGHARGTADSKGNRELKCAKTCNRGFSKSAGRCLRQCSGMIARNITVLALNIVGSCTTLVRKLKGRGKRRAAPWIPSRNCSPSFPAVAGRNRTILVRLRFFGVVLLPAGLTLAPVPESHSRTARRDVPIVASREGGSEVCGCVPRDLVGPLTGSPKKYAPDNHGGWGWGGMGRRRRYRRAPLL